MQPNKKNIVILGGGYGGVMAALSLEKKIRKQRDIQITLIDKHNYQLYGPNLYEIATAEEELASQQQLKKSITIPFAEIFSGKRINFVQAEITGINQAEKFVQTGTKRISYDYLITALGSTSDYFGIEGAKEFVLALKNFTDALRIKNQIEFAVQAHRFDTNKKNLRIVVAGGGYTGCEFAAELSHEVELLAYKNNYPPEKIEVAIIEATNQLIPGFSERLSQDALWKLKNRGVIVHLSTPVIKIDQHFITVLGDEKIAYDVLVWAVGVKAAAIPFAEAMEQDKKGRIFTNEFLQSKKFQNIFVLGDCACVTNSDGKPAHPTAQDAIEQAKYISYALPLIMQNQRPKPYYGKNHGFIVSLGGRYAILDYGGFYFKGLFAYIVRLFAQLDYYRKVVGWWKAFKYTLFGWEVYGRND